MAHPTNLTLRGGDVLRIEWSDGQAREYAARELREACPCATCRERRSKPPEPAPLLPVISPEEAQPLKLTAMQPVGTYAYAIHFSDGHNTGIFTLEHLRELGSEAEA